MAFLEAMAMGKCVVANDDATMNEYIRDGKNGILFQRGDIRPVSGEAVASARANVAASAAAWRGRWLRDAAAVNVFLRGQRPCSPSPANRLKTALAGPLFLAEGALHKLAALSSLPLP